MTEINKKQEIIKSLKRVGEAINDIPNEKHNGIPTRIKLILRMLNNAINEIEDKLVEKEWGEHKWKLKS